MTRVLALDPGERVGWARADVASDGAWTDLRHGITPLRDMALAISGATITPATVYQGEDTFADYVDPAYDVIVIEDWRLYATNAREMIGSAFPSVQFIGMVKLCCWLSHVKLVTQGASAKKTADKTMKALWPELYDKVTAPRAHDDAHDMDALRHLWIWTFRNTTIHTPVAPEAV